MSEDEDDASSFVSLVNEKTTIYSVREKIKEAKIKLYIYNGKCSECDRYFNELKDTQAINNSNITTILNQAINHLTAVHKMGKKRPKIVNSKKADNIPTPQAEIPVPLYSANEPKVSDPRQETSNTAGNTPHAINETDNDNFKLPFKTVGFKKLVYQRTLDFGTPIPVKNSFAPLQHEVNFDFDDSASEASVTPSLSNENIAEKARKIATSQKAKTAPTKITKPPPIVIKGKIKNHKTLGETLNKLGINNYSIRYAKNSTIVYCELLKDWQTLARNLEAEAMEHHTYAEKTTKSHAFVLRGLDGDISINEIKEDLSDKYEINPKTIYLMKGTKDPLYLVILESTITVKQLNQKCKIILNVRVSWENRKSERPIMQCKRCQGLGHAASYCKRAVRCSRCAEPHEITACESQINKCANCGEAHRSIDPNCPVYVYKLRKLEPRQRYIPAPPPKTSAWEKRTNTPTTSSLVPRPAPERYDRDFPAPHRRSNAQEPPASQASSSINANRGVVSDDQSAFLSLADAMKELNSLVNLPELLKAVKDFVNTLKQCNGDKSLIMQATMGFFTEGISKYNF